jgi:peroxin-19
MLDEFSTVKIDSKKPEVASGPGRPEEPAKATAPPEPPNDEALSDEDFAKQLQAGMADLLGDLQSNVSVGQ